MQEGFDYLESGNFAKAEVFFEAILRDYPDNKTARLCYGRALGLNDNPKKAIDIFNTLLEESPENLEVKLNLAEAYLWNKDYQTALPYYKTLVDEYPQNTTALIGLGNTHSILGNNMAAEPYLTKVLQLDPNNVSAQKSLQYVRLGLAQSAINNNDTDTAKKILNSNMELPVDLTPTYLNLANLSIITQSYQQAKKQYLKILEAQPNNLQAHQGLTTVYHLLDKKKKRNAASSRVKALIEKDQTTDLSALNNNYTQYIQSLIWDHQYDKVTTLISASIQNELITDVSALTLKARMNSQLQNHNKALRLYNGMINQDQSNIEGWIGRTQTLISMDSIETAHSTLGHALIRHPNNQVLKAIEKTLIRSDLPKLKIDSYYNSDSGGDNALNGMAQIDIPISKKLSILTSYQQRTTYRQSIETSRHHRFGLAGVNFKIKPYTSITAEAGYSAISEASEAGKPIVLISAKTKINRQTIKIGYSNLYQDYNSNLLYQGFVQNRFFGIYNVSNHRGLGLYAEANQSFFSDLNKSTSLFISGYKSIKQRPYLKLGINLQGLTFREKKETLYFSPPRFIGAECFIDLVRSEDMFMESGVTYLVTTAGGFQRVDGNTEPTYRLLVSLGYRFKSGVTFSSYGVVSNIAANSVSGFKYQSLGLKITSHLTQKPLFTRG